MENQPNSPPPAESSGTTIGVVDQFFDNFRRHNGIAEDDPCVPYTRYVFYCGVAQMYNVWVEALRKDHSMGVTMNLSHAVMVDINSFFAAMEAQQKGQVN